MTILLSDVVAQVESGGCLDAIRYEPTYTPSENAVNNAIKYASGCWISATTAKMLCMTSWGKYQIMGSNLYGVMSYQKTLVNFLRSTYDQYAIFNEFIAKGGFTDQPINGMDSAELNRFALYYNGSIIYAASLKAVKV